MKLTRAKPEPEVSRQPSSHTAAQVCFRSDFVDASPKEPVPSLYLSQNPRFPFPDCGHGRSPHLLITMYRLDWPSSCRLGGIRDVTDSGSPCLAP
jgi:hypothetical protein